MLDQAAAEEKRVSVRAVATAGLPMLAAGGALLLYRIDQAALALLWGAALSGVLAWLSQPAERARAQAQLFSTTLARIATGELRTIDADLATELGPFVHPLRQLLVRGHGVRRIVGRLRGSLAGLPEIIDRTNHEVTSSRSDIEETVEETASLLAHINGSIRGITAEVESLAASSEQASTSTLQMGTAIDEVARNAGALHDAAGASASAVHELSGSIRQVADGADAVQGMAEESAAAMVQMDRAIQEVTQHVSGASTLTQQVSADAEEGSLAVVDTIEGIDEIRRQTLEARSVLERLAERIAEIGEIVNVIGGINEETNLLSLNAAIIAAQAGEQGKAFAVVANHVKTLAQRTAGSTREIETLIRAVQQESGNAVHAMGAGIDAVESGVERSRKAGGALEAIRERAREASVRVAEIARASQEQSKNSKHVAEAAQRTSTMVQQISEAMGGQSSASQNLLRNAESSLDLCGQVQRSIEEQRETTRYITASVSAITEMIKSIRANTESHGAASEAVQEAVMRILEIARRSGTASASLTQQLEQLRAEALAEADASPEAGASAETEAAVEAPPSA
jgi:methyl-accepting chemotaxis protein